MKSPMQLCFSGILILTCAVGCSKSDSVPPEENDGEMITTVRLKFVNQADNADQTTVNWRDADGQGGNAAIIDSIVLRTNTQYTMTVDAVLNESVTPPGDITPEIRAEAEHHLFVFQSTLNGTRINITDTDKNGLPVGFTSAFSTAQAGSGNLRVILRHQVNSKDGTPNPGSSDIDCSFPLVAR